MPHGVTDCLHSRSSMNSLEGVRRVRSMVFTFRGCLKKKRHARSRAARSGRTNLRAEAAQSRPVEFCVFAIQHSNVPSVKCQFRLGPFTTGFASRNRQGPVTNGSGAYRQRDTMGCPHAPAHGPSYESPELISASTQAEDN